jgi:uridine phosphorylase
LGVVRRLAIAAAVSHSSIVRAVPLEQRPRPLHLRPATELAERVLLPGDPHRALAVAQSLLDQPRMFNHARGLWGYSGLARDGELLSVQSTGMGGPSAAIVAEELIALGARRLVRIGTCGALGDGLALGDLVTASRVIPTDGTSAALGADGELRPDPELRELLVRAGAPAAGVE